MIEQIQPLIPMLIYGLAILVFVLAIALAFIVVSYRKIVLRLASFEDKESKVVVKANQEALEIVRKAQEQASKIIEGSGTLVKYNNSLLERDLRAISEKQMTAYKQALDSLRSDTLQIAKNISEDIKQTGESEFSSLKKAYEQKFEKSFASMQSEIDKYKKERLLQIDTQVQEIIRNTALSVLNKSLTQREHTELVLKSLEEAKSKHVF